jgi:transcriptional regulator with XRE-family HTH domain
MENIAGSRIRELRRAKSPPMTQADLARALQLRGLNIDRAGVAKIEGGYRQLSDIELVVAADALGVPPPELLHGLDFTSLLSSLREAGSPPRHPTE